MSTGLRIAIVGPYPREEGKPCGGVEAVTESLAGALARVPHTEVHAVTSVGGLKKPLRYTNSRGVDVHLVPLFGKLGCLTRFAVDAPRVRSELRLIDPGIVHVQGQLMYAFAALERHWPSVLTIHGICFREAATHKGVRGLQTRYGCKYERDALDRARHLILLNEYSRDILKPYIRTDDIRLIDNPILDSFFDIDNREEKGNILHLSVIRRLKSIDTIVRAAGRLRKHGKDIRAYIVGPVAEHEYFQELQSIAEEESVTDYIHYPGAAGSKEVADYYSRASVVVLPSLVENAPMVISEAMAAGKPVIATPAGGIPTMIDHGRTGFVVPFGDSDALADAVGTLLDDDDLRKQMGTAAREEAEKRYRAAAVAEKTLDCYRHIIEGRRENPTRAAVSIRD